MDELQTVDCFERLCGHLLRHAPDIQKRVDLLRSSLLSSQNLTFFLSHLIALLSKIDDQSAEGKRRIRRYIIELGAGEPEGVAKGHLMVREQGGVWGKPLSEGRKKQLEASFRNLRNLSDDPEHTGAVLTKALAQQEHLPGRVDYLRKLLPSLTSLNIFQYMSRVGMPVLVPDASCQLFLYRLGCIGQTGNTLAAQLEACRAAEKIAESINRPVSELNLWIQHFTGSTSDVPPQISLCRRAPNCVSCPISTYCQYFRFNRPRAADSSAPLPIKQWRPGERPRERLMLHGAHALEEAELLAIVLRTGSGDMNVLELSRRLLEAFGNLQRIEDASLEELQKIHGIGKMKAIELKAVFELGRRLIYNPIKPGETFRSSDDIYYTYRGRFTHVKQEEFILLMLNKKNQVIREEVISRGSLEAAVVHPREVFKAAIRASAAAVVFIHNHPSGDPSPSHDDHVITRRLEEAAELLQIRVLDHLVIGSNSYYSFTDGEISKPKE